MGQSSPFARAEVVGAADEPLGIVGAVVPNNLIRVRTPLEPVALLPIPGGGFADFGPFVPILEIDVTPITAIVRPHITARTIDSESQEVTSGGIELKNLIKEKAVVKAVLGRSWV